MPPKFGLAWRLDWADGYATARQFIAPLEAGLKKTGLTTLLQRYFNWLADQERKQVSHAQRKLLEMYTSGQATEELDPDKMIHVAIDRAAHDDSDPDDPSMSGEARMSMLKQRVFSRKSLLSWVKDMLFRVEFMRTWYVLPCRRKIVPKRG